MANTDYPYDDPYFGYYDPYYGFYGEPYNSYKNGFNGPYRSIPPERRNRETNTPPVYAPYGPHTGYGPRNYRRPDNRIREDICDRLWADGQLDAADVDVSVDNGVVTLDGTVDNRAAKRRADDVAWSAPGVTDVVNELRPRSKS